MFEVKGKRTILLRESVSVLASIINDQQADRYQVINASIGIRAVQLKERVRA